MNARKHFFFFFNKIIATLIRKALTVSMKSSLSNKYKI